MKRLVSWGITLALLLVVVAFSMVSWVYLASERRFGRSYDVPARQLEVTADRSQLQRGAHLAQIWGCRDCHGEDLAGGVVADVPPMLLVSPNLTSGRGGVGSTYGSRDWVRAVRHGVAPDGHPLLFMPSHEYWVLSDSDLAALMAYLEGVDPVDRVQPVSVIRGLGRFLFVTGRLPLVPAELIDHEAPRPTAPPPARSVAYGAYLATGCGGCHGFDLEGGTVPGAPPDWPAASNLTPDTLTGIGRWTQEDFFQALRRGKRPDGSDIDSVMPWRNTAAMTDQELESIWMYLQSLPPSTTVADPPGAD